MRKRRGIANLAKIVIGRSAPDPEDRDPIKDLDYDDNSADKDSDRFEYFQCNDDQRDLTLH
jgi:hypothetical protein